MKKRFLLSACVLIVIAVCFVIYAMWHPELSFPWSASITYVLYGLYVDGIVLLFILAFWKKTDGLNVFTAIMELGAVFFLIQSMFSVVKEGNANWYLPLALGLNCIGLLLNAIQRKKQKDNE